MPTESHAGTVALRTALRELVALSTIPAAWVGREPPIIAAGLADVLVGSLHLDFAFVRLCDPKGGAAIEVTRGTRGKDSPNGCKSTWAACANFLVRKSFLTLAARSHAAVLSFPLASMPRVVWSLRRALAPTFPARLTSCCFPWRPTTLRQRFRTRVCATSSTRRWRNSVRPATNSR